MPLLIGETLILEYKGKWYRVTVVEEVVSIN